jgi:hypothetical protein
MPKMTQFCVGLENKPGMLAKLSGSLSRANVNIDALFISEDDEGCWANLIASPASEAEDALAADGYNYYEEEVLALRAMNRPGELERISARLAEVGVNINYVYGSTAGDAPFTLVMHVSDLERALKQLER